MLRLNLSTLYDKQIKGNVKRIVSNKITFLIRGKINIILILNEIFIINTVYFHFSQSKLVKQCFIELLNRMKKIQFLHMNLIFGRKKYRENVCIG